MPKPHAELPELAGIARALEDELRALESAALASKGIRLNTRKGLLRGAKVVEEAFAGQARLGEHLKNFGEAMTRLQERQLGAVGTIGIYAQQIEARSARMTDHMQRFAELGQQAVEVTQLLQQATGPVDGDTDGVLHQVEQSLGNIVEQARELMRSAHAEDLPEIGKEAEALAQKFQAARSKLVDAGTRAESGG